jgi:hypothetical protein
MSNCQKNNRHTKYTVKTPILCAQFYAVISLKRKCVKKRNPLNMNNRTQLVGVDPRIDPY